MSYEISKNQPPTRAPFMLHRQPVPVPGAEPVDGQLPTFIPYNEIAPGLYPDETVYRLDTGEDVALSVSTKRIATGGGMEFQGWARVIEPDGRTMRDKAGEEMELHSIHPVDAATFERLDEPDAPAEAKISREVMLLMLGEDPTMVDVHVDPDALVPEIALDDADWKRNPHKAPPGTVLNPGESRAPMIGWADEVRLNASIRHALKLFRRAQPEVDVAAVLAQE